MTTLRFRRAIPVAIPDPLRPAWCEPDETAAVGVIELRPHARQHETAGGHRVVLPALLTLALVAGEATVDVEPGHWQVRERIRAGAAQPWTVLVPDAVGIVDDCDLVIIDPATLTPATPPTDAWLAALSAVAEGIPGAVADYLDANPPSAAPDATTTLKGLLKLAGDLAGTADAPTVPGLAALDGRLDAVEVRPVPDVTAAQLAAHAADSTSVHGIADTGALVLDDDPRLIDARPPTAHGHNLDAVTDTATRLALTPAERTKLSGVATGATANSTDAQLRDRSTHTGTQAVSTVTGLQSALDGKAPTLGADDNYVTDAEKSALHAHANKTALDAVSGINTGDQTLPTWSTLSGKPPVIGAGADAAAARAAIGAGTLNADTAQAINAQTGTTYTLVAADAGRLATLTNAAAITLTVPAGVFTAGQRVDVLVLGAGMVTAVAGAGATLTGTPSLVSRAQYSAFTVLYLTASSAVVIGCMNLASVPSRPSGSVATSGWHPVSNSTLPCVCRSSTDAGINNRHQQWC